MPRGVPNRTCRACGRKRDKGESGWAEGGRGWVCPRCLTAEWEALSYRLLYAMPKAVEEYSGWRLWHSPQGPATGQWSAI
jgi:hypothetical protein